MKRRKKKIPQMNIRQILLDLGIDYKDNKNDLWFRCICPDHNETKASAHIKTNIQDKYYGVWYCFGCGKSGNIYTLIRHVLSCSTNEAKVYVSKYIGKQNIHYKKIDNEVKLPTKLPIFYESPKIWIERYFKYLQQRKVSRRQINKYKIGYADSGKYNERIIFPVYLGNEYKGFVARTINSDLEPKDLKTNNMRPGLFGSQHIYRRLPCIISEGIFDSLSVERCGYLNSYAITGNRIDNEIVSFLRKFPYTIIVPDNDNGGDNLIDLCGEMSSYLNIFVADVKRFGKYKDPAECSEVERNDLIIESIKEAERWKPSIDRFEVEIVL